MIFRSYAYDMQCPGIYFYQNVCNIYKQTHRHIDKDYKIATWGPGHANAEAGESSPINREANDLKKVFDCVKREVSYNILTEFGIPKNIASLIKSA